MSSDSCLFIRHARILLPEGEFFEGDIQTHGREIVQIAPEIPASEAVAGDREIDATGLTLLPGVIDPQVHFREPGLEHKEDLFTASCGNTRKFARSHRGSTHLWNQDFYGFSAWSLIG